MRKAGDSRGYAFILSIEILNVCLFNNHVCLPAFLACVSVTLSGLWCCFVCAGGLPSLKCQMNL